MMKRVLTILAMTGFLANCAADEGSFDDVVTEEESVASGTSADEKAGPSVEGQEAGAEAAVAGSQDQAPEGESPVVDQSIEAKDPVVQGPAEEATSAAVELQAAVMYPTTSHLNIRSGPGMNQQVVRVAVFGEALSITGASQGVWFELTDKTWASSLYLAKDKPASAMHWEPKKDNHGTMDDQSSSQSSPTTIEESSEKTSTPEQDDSAEQNNETEGTSEEK
jgi:uncharacterized protein YraI